MKFISHSNNRAVYGLAAVFLFAATAVSFLAPGTASAAQVTSRSIQMSSSTQGATGTTYKVQFTVATTAVIQGIVVDFCDNSPLIGDATCTPPTGFSITATPAVSNITGLNPTTGWSAAQRNTNRTLTLTNGSAGSVNAATVVSFDLTTATNPTTNNHTFYARILTYTTAAGATTTYAPGSEGAFTDYGGVALSTGRVINITARVMESLAFCVYDAACGDDPSFTLGHGTNMILDTTAVDTDTASFSISTNAQSGAIVNIKGDTLKSGSNDIDAAGAAAVAFVAGTEKFGTRVSTSGTNITAAAPYNGAANNYGFDTASTTSTYGDLIATLSGPVNTSVSTLTYGATASNTTAAGIYTSAQQLIATGTF